MSPRTVHERRFVIDNVILPDGGGCRVGIIIGWSSTLPIWMRHRLPRVDHGPVYARTATGRAETGWYGMSQLTERPSASAEESLYVLGGDQAQLRCPTAPKRGPGAAHNPVRKVLSGRWGEGGGGAHIALPT